MLNSEFIHFMRSDFNPFMPNGDSHRYQLEQSISVLRDVRWYFFFYFCSSFYRKLCKPTVATLVRRRILCRLIWVCTICLCPTKTLGIYGLKLLISLELQKFGKFIVEIIFLVKLH